jgi:hypothetical protein
MILQQRVLKAKQHSRGGGGGVLLSHHPTCMLSLATACHHLLGAGICSGRSYILSVSCLLSSTQALTLHLLHQVNPWGGSP